LENVEVYNPANDTWEDGIPLTSGRSGLASAVIYQPSCSQHYMQENMLAQQVQRESSENNRSQNNSSESTPSMQINHPTFNRSNSNRGNQSQDDMGEVKICSIGSKEEILGKPSKKDFNFNRDTHRINKRKLNNKRDNLPYQLHELGKKLKYFWINR
jgi:hypothetical protein